MTAGAISRRQLGADFGGSSSRPRLPGRADGAGSESLTTWSGGAAVYLRDGALRPRLATAVQTPALPGVSAPGPSLENGA